MSQLVSKYEARLILSASECDKHHFEAYFICGMMG